MVDITQLHEGLSAAAVEAAIAEKEKKAQVEAFESEEAQFSDEEVRCHFDAAI